MQSCTICGKAYEQGETVDIGIGFMQVAEDIPVCDCEYIEWMENNDTKEGD